MSSAAEYADIYFEQEQVGDYLLLGPLSIGTGEALRPPVCGTSFRGWPAHIAPGAWLTSNCLFPMHFRRVSLGGCNLTVIHGT